MSTTLNADRVQTIMLDVLFTDEEFKAANLEVPGDAVIVEGIVNTYGFHPGRLESHRADVATMLEDLPEIFKASVGGGWSFLQMCVDKEDHQWGEHKNMEELCCLAIGLKLGEWMVPRDYWPMLPGGMPYFVYLDKE